DIVLNRSMFLGGRYAACFEELAAAREAAGSAHLKVILETHGVDGGDARDEPGRVPGCIGGEPGVVPFDLGCLRHRIVMVAHTGRWLSSRLLATRKDHLRCARSLSSSDPRSP
ncbi:MAG: hypothetical protein ACXWX0_04780, partial [Actinomycetota bacterium]